MFNEALPLAEHINTELNSLDQWIKEVNRVLQESFPEQMPENPEPLVEKIKVIRSIHSQYLASMVVFGWRGVTS